MDGARSLTDARYGAVGVFDGSGRVRQFIYVSDRTRQETTRVGDLARLQGLPQMVGGRKPTYSMFVSLRYTQPTTD